MCKPHKHFDKYDRDMIEKFLDQGLSAKNIAAHLDKSPRAVSYEILHHRQNYPGKVNCYKVNDCTRKNVCWDCPAVLRHRVCKNCKHRSCSDYCSDVSKTPKCDRLLRFPYVCNACADKDKCRSPKYFYKSSRAEEIYAYNVSNWKEGPKLSIEERVEIDNVISQAVRNGHSITAAVRENNLNIHETTAYRYLHRGYLSVHEIDLPYQVRYKSRKKAAKPVYTVNYDYLTGRRIEDFTEYISTHPGITIWQMDTVEGVKAKEEPCILSLLLITTNLQLYFKLERKTTEEVNKVFSYIKNSLGAQLFKMTFPVILTDNGSEFKDPKSIEDDVETGEQLIRVFYCHPSRSDEKGACERNHRELRRMVPQGISWKPYTSADINYISNNVNNYYRAQFSKSPYELSKHILDPKVLALNHLEFIPPEKVFINRYIIKSPVVKTDS